MQSCIIIITTLAFVHIAAATPQQSTSSNSNLPGLSERELYGSVSLDQFAQGYGANNGGETKVERIDEPVRQLPTVEESSNQGREEIVDHRFPDEQRQGQVNLNKEIHTYTIQKKIVNTQNRVLHRYLKNLLINTLYNTNIQRIKHQKLVNMLVNTLQEVHQPKLLIKYSRKDTVQDGGERNEQQEVSEERQDKTLPPVFLPATAEKVGYDGQGLGGTVSAAGSASSGGGFGGSTSG